MGENDQAEMSVLETLKELRKSRLEFVERSRDQELAVPKLLSSCL